MTIVDLIEADLQQAATVTLKQYRELLERIDNPRPGDKVNLAKLLTTLELTPADASSDAAATKQLAQLQRDAADAAEMHKTSIDGVPAALAVFQQREKELQAAQKALYDARLELCRLEDTKNMADLRRRQAAEGIENLRASNPRVF
jgi:hypothetical protein